MSYKKKIKTKDKYSVQGENISRIVRIYHNDIISLKRVRAIYSNFIGKSVQCIGNNCLGIIYPQTSSNRQFTRNSNGTFNILQQLQVTFHK